MNKDSLKRITPSGDAASQGNVLDTNNPTHLSTTVCSHDEIAANNFSSFAEPSFIPDDDFDLSNQDLKHWPRTTFLSH